MGGGGGGRGGGRGGDVQAEKSPRSYRRAWRLVGSAVAPARLASLAPKVGGRLQQPHCHRRKKKTAYFFFIAVTQQDSSKTLARLKTCRAGVVLAAFTKPEQRIQVSASLGWTCTLTVLSKEALINLSVWRRVRRHVGGGGGEGGCSFPAARLGLRLPSPPWMTTWRATPRASGARTSCVYAAALARAAAFQLGSEVSICNSGDKTRFLHIYDIYLL